MNKKASLANSDCGPIAPAANVLQSTCACGTHTVGGSECTECAKGKTSLQRQATEPSPLQNVPPVVDNVLASPGEPLDSGTRAFFEPRFGRNFSGVRVHTNQEAAQSADAVRARAYASNQSLVFAQGQYRPNTGEGRELLAHELAHVTQQEKLSPKSDSNERSVSQPDEPSERAADQAAKLVMSGRNAPPMPAMSHAVVQPKVDDPSRYKEVHESLFVAAPSTGGSLLTWEDPDPAKKIAGTEEKLFQQAKPAIQAHVKANPGSVGGTVTTKTTEAALDTDAVAVKDELRARFPFMSITPSDAQVQTAVSVMTPALTSSSDYLHEWMANKLPNWSDVENYDIKEDDPRLVALFDRLLTDTDVGPDLKVMATRVSGFQRGQGTTREIFVHRGTEPLSRKKVLFHELTHFHAHPSFRSWVATTTNERWYNEGFTEYVARLAMPPEVLAIATSYQDRVDSIKNEVAAHVPDDDIARAYFLGEVWRIETRSTISRHEAAHQLNLSATATEAEEKKASRSGPGINETVEKGKHYRFMNLGFDQMTPKPEHITFFKDIKAEELDAAPTLGVSFEGHASTAGSLEYNKDLSLGRARAFYQLAKKEGITGTRLIDEANPPHFGESKTTADEEDPVTRAFNRRVEMQIHPTGKNP